MTQLPSLSLKVCFKVAIDNNLGCDQTVLAVVNVSLDPAISSRRPRHAVAAIVIGIILNRKRPPKLSHLNKTVQVIITIGAERAIARLVSADTAIANSR